MKKKSTRVIFNDFPDQTQAKLALRGLIEAECARLGWPLREFRDPLQHSVKPVRGFGALPRPRQEHQVEWEELWV